MSFRNPSTDNKLSEVKVVNSVQRIKKRKKEHELAKDAFLLTTYVAIDKKSKIIIQTKKQL